MILVVAAISEEISEITKAMKEKKEIKLRHLVIYEGILNGVHILLADLGLGKVNSSFGLSLILDNYDIDLVVNIGSCGATNDFTIGDIVCVERCQYHDFSLTPLGYKPREIPNLPYFFETNGGLLERIRNKKPKFKFSTLYSGDKFITQEELTKISLPEPSYICDMEGTALYHVSHFLKVDILSVKIVSDIVNKIDNIKFYQEFEHKRIGTYCLSLLEELLEII